MSLNVHALHEPEHIKRGESETIFIASDQKGGSSS